jgi:hypothetical protein
MKRHVLTRDRWVSVEDGTVRDLDGNLLGGVERFTTGWDYRPACYRSRWADAAYGNRAAAIVALLADPSCPTPGPNRYDKP